MTERATGSEVDPHPEETARAILPKDVWDPRRVLRRTRLLLRSLRRHGRRIAPRGSIARRVAIGLVAGCLVAGVILSGIYVRLLSGPIPLSYLEERITAAVQERLPDGLSIDVGSTVFERREENGRFYLSLLDVRLKGASGIDLFNAPKASVRLSVLGLMTGRVVPQAMWLVEPAFTLVDTGNGLRLQSIAAGGGKDGARGRPTAPPQDPLDSLAIVFALLTGDTGMSSLGVSDASIAVTRGEGEPAVLNEVTLAARRGEKPDAVTVTASIGDARGAPRLEGVVAREGDGDLMVDLDLDNLAAPDLGPVLPESVVDLFTSPVSSEITARIGPDGEIETAEGGILVGAGRIGLGEEKLLIDEAEFGFEWSTATRTLTIRPSTVLAGPNRGTVAGEIIIPERGEFSYGSVPVRLQLSDVVFGDPEGGRPAIYPSVTLEAIYLQREGLLHVGRLDIAATEAAASLVGFVGGSAGETPAVRLAGSALPMPIEALKDLWPPFIGKGSRRWITENFEGGTITDAQLSLDIRAGALAAAARGLPLPESAYSLEFKVRDATFGYLGDMPPITGAQGTAVLTPATFELRTDPGAHIELETGERIEVGAGRFHIADRRAEPGIGHVSLEVSATTAALLRLLDHEPIRLAQRRGLDPGTLGGDGTFDVALDIPLMKDLRVADVGVTVDGLIEGFSARDFAGAKQVEDGRVELSVADGRISVTGEAVLDGMPAEIAFSDSVDGSGDGGDRSITMVLDEAARETLGVPVRDLLSGPVTVTVSDVEPAEGGTSQRIEADLTEAHIDFAALGLQKPAGEDATATFTLVRGASGVRLEDIDFRSGAIRISGEAAFDGQGGLQSLDLPTVRTARGTDISVSGTTRDGGESYTLRGEVLDLRPALRALRGGGAEEGDGAGGPTKRIDIEVASAMGFNGRSIEDLDATVEVSGGRTTRVAATGTIESLPVGARYSDDGTNTDLILDSGSAGGVLAWSGLYANMRGGMLRLAAGRRGAEAPMTGRLVIDGFAIADDPSLSQLIESGRSSRRGASAQARGVNASNVGFETLNVPFQSSGSTLRLSEGVLRGPAVGATIEGTVDLAADRLQLSGTYVPLYEINNLFGQIPIFGPLLGGKRNEGLFGITYSISGPTASPVLTINPLSAVAPGVFRYILGMDNPRAAGQNAPQRRGDPSMMR